MNDPARHQSGPWSYGVRQEPRKTACVTSSAPSSPGRGGWGAGGRCAYTLVGPSVRSR